MDLLQLQIEKSEEVANSKDHDIRFSRRNSSTHSWSDY